MLYASRIIGISGEKLRRVIYHFSSSIRQKWDIKQDMDKLLLWSNDRMITCT